MVWYSSGGELITELCGSGGDGALMLLTPMFVLVVGGVYTPWGTGYEIEEKDGVFSREGIFWFALKPGCAVLFV